MAIVFPVSPSVNDTFTEGSITYKWDGDKWISLGVTPTDKLTEGSNSLEITDGNDLSWTGGNVTFESGGSERVRITSGFGGNLLVGMDTVYNVNATAQIRDGINIVASDENGDVTQVNSAGEPVGRILFGDTRPGTYAEINCIADGVCGTNDYPGRLVFRTTSDGSGNTAERLRITSSGDLFVAGTGGMNTTQLPNGHTININGNSSNDGFSVIRYSSGYGAYGLNIGRSNSNTVGTNAAVTNGNDLGHITFYGADGTDFNQAVMITAQVDGNPSDGTDMPGRLIFKTSPEGPDSAPIERLRITSAGFVGVGKVPSYLLDVNDDASFNGVRVGRGGGDDNTNTAVGLSALSNNTSGYRNTAVGNQALNSNLGGIDNTAVGQYALRANTSGNSNIAIGRWTMLNNISGHSNTAIGDNSLGVCTGGFRNIAIGFNAGSLIANNSGNTIIGCNIPGTSSLTDTVIIGAGNGLERLRVDGNGLYIGGTNCYFSSLPTGGSYGTVQVNGNGGGGWEGYSINGRSGFIHDGSTTMGLFDDVNNHWVIKHSMQEFDSFTTLHAGNGAEKIRILHNGGITFNGDTAAANALDDYEEGTWTPSLISGYTSPSYGTQEGTYIKIGKLVFIRGVIRPSNGTSTTSSGVQIGGLPYSAGSTGQIIVSLSGVNSSANHRSIYGELSSNSQVDLYYRGDSAIFTASGNSIGANFLTFIRFSGTYSTS